MVGHWGLSFNVTPKTGQPFTALRRRPRNRMSSDPRTQSGRLAGTWARLAGAAAALAAGTVAVVVAVLLLHTVFG